MSTMIERVARSMRKAYSMPEAPGQPLCAWKNSRARDAWMLCARAAIEAMREPNAAQHDALTSLARTLIEDAHERDNYAWFAVKAWRAMIDAAKAEIGPSSRENPSEGAARRKA